MFVIAGPTSNATVGWCTENHVVRVYSFRPYAIGAEVSAVQTVGRRTRVFSVRYREGVGDGRRENGKCGVDSNYFDDEP